MDTRPNLSSDLAALISRHPGLLSGGLPAASGLSGADALSLSHNSAAISSLLPSLLLRQQAEERQKIAIAQQLATLSGASALTSLAAVPPPPADNLALLLQQRQQLQTLQAGNASLDRLAALRASAAADVGFGAPSVGAGQLDALAKLVQVQQQQHQQQQQAGPQDAAILNANLPMDRKRKGRTGTFPQKLHQILQELERQEGGAEIASFLPHGRAFAIHKPREFVKHIMPKYFRMSRFSSFQRQLNLYDFQRVTEGPDKGAYYHELFVKGRPILSTMMKRNKIKGVKLNDDKSEDGDEKSVKET